MSDFLSKFNKDKYDELVDEQAEKKTKQSDDTGETVTDEDSQIDTDKNKQKATAQEKEAPSKGTTEPKKTAPSQKQPSTHRSDGATARDRYRQNVEEEIEIDVNYRRKQRLKWIWISVGAVVTGIVLFFIYHMLVHVKVEDFIGEAVSDARAWAKENGVEIELEQEHSMEYDVNDVFSQSVDAGDKIRKGKTLELTASLGPDPEEHISLPDFSEMSQTEAEMWMEEQKAENMRIVTEYNDDIDAGEFIKFTIRDDTIDESEYRRKDSAAIYYSRGEEVLEKNISVPNFSGMSKFEVDNWAESNEIDITYETKDSDSVELDHVISQSIAADEKVAKNDEIEIVLSAGKAIVVPDFSEFTAEEAMMNEPALNVVVKNRFHESISYGKLISQSVEAGEKLMEHDDDLTIVVTYSEGKPYLRDYHGQLEGDLPQLFFDDYESKGANIKYTIRYVDSPETKGTIVGMSQFNAYVSMNYTVEIKVSNNKRSPLDPPEPEPSPIPDPMPDPEPTPNPEPEKAPKSSKKEDKDDEENGKGDKE